MDTKSKPSDPRETCEDHRDKCSSDVCETSPAAPFNQHPERPLGTHANAEVPQSRTDEIEREKQYYKGGVKP